MSKINITINLPDSEEKKKEYAQPTLEDKCCDYMEMCESDEDSNYHWNYLKTVYNKLSKKKNLPAELRPLLSKLEEFMMKHGSVDSDVNKAELQKDTLDMTSNHHYDDNTDTGDKTDG